MPCDYHLGQLASNEKALRQGKFTAELAAAEESKIRREMEKCCP